MLTHINMQRLTDCVLPGSYDRLQEWCVHLLLFLPRNAHQLWNSDAELIRPTTFFDCSRVQPLSSQVNWNLVFFWLASPMSGFLNTIIPTMLWPIGYWYWDLQNTAVSALNFYKLISWIKCFNHPQIPIFQNISQPLYQIWWCATILFSIALKSSWPSFRSFSTLLSCFIQMDQWCDPVTLLNMRNRFPTNTTSVFWHGGCRNKKLLIALVKLNNFLLAQA